jgi:hypothetical protein
VEEGDDGRAGLAEAIVVGGEPQPADVERLGLSGPRFEGRVRVGHGGHRTQPSSGGS